MADFLHFLGLPEDADEEVATLSLTAMLTSAVRDDEPVVPLSDLYHRIVSQNGSKYLDPLNVLPLLLHSSDPRAQDLVAMIGECSSAREALIATQECMERLTNDLQRNAEDDDDEGGQTKRERAPNEVLIAMIDVYSAAIPRLKLRKKSGVETIQTHIEELQEAIDAVAFDLGSDDAARLLKSVSHLAERVHSWLQADPKSPESDLLPNVLEHALLPSARVIRSCIAQRTFEELNPRFRRPGGATCEFKDLDEAINGVFDAFKVLGYTPSLPSETSLIGLAHSRTEETSSPAILATYLPLLIASVHSNLLLDETLAVLLKCLYHPGKNVITDEIAGPLLSVLPELASGHPDPQVRHLTFRILSRLLASTAPALRMQILADLTANQEFPQLRIASVGLVKEALLESFGAPSGNPFASPLFLRTFGPILLRPNLQFTTLDEFEESQEPKRLVECLSLYYVLLERDIHNVTGIRDPDAIRNVETNLLCPLESKLKDWDDLAEGSIGDDHHFNPLLPLQIALERVEEAKARLHL